MDGDHTDNIPLLWVSNLANPSIHPAIDRRRPEPISNLRLIAILDPLGFVGDMPRFAQTLTTTRLKLQHAGFLVVSFFIIVIVCVAIGEGVLGRGIPAQGQASAHF